MWSMVSNAADRSKRVRAVTDPLAILRRMSLWILRTALSIEWCFLYADWKAVIRPASSPVDFPKMFDKPLDMFSAISIDLSMHAAAFHFC